MGIETLLQQNIQNAGLAGSDRLARNAMFPQSQMDKTQYAVPSQLPTSAEAIRSDYDAPTNAYTGLPTQPFAEGGLASIPRYADGGLFNRQAYLAANPDVAASGLDPYQHYQEYGQREGRQALFDAQPETTPSGIAGLAPTQNQYQDQAAFNSAAYLAANPDVAASGLDPYQHYLQYGKNEGRQAAFDQQMAGWDAPTQNQLNFDAQAYLAANQDVARSGLDPYQHYIKYGQQEGRQATYKPVTTSDPSQWEQRTYGIDPYTGEGGLTYYVDPATGNAYNVGQIADPYTGESTLDFANAQRVASGNALNDPFLKASGLDSDPTKAQELYSLKETNPNAYYSTIADKLQNQIFQGYYSNANTDAQIDALDRIKNLDPAAYYENKIKSIGHNIGWNIGQNTPDRNAPKAEELNKLIPEAINAGLSPQQINDLVNQTASEAAQANQMRIANEKAAGQGTLNGLPQFAATVGAMFAAPALAGYLTPALGATMGGAATGAILGGGVGAINAASSDGNIGKGILKGAAIGGVGGGIAGGISDAFSAASMPTEEAMAAYANSTPDPIQTMAELKSMTPAQLSQAFGPGAGETSSKFVQNLVSKLGSKLATAELAKILGGSTSAASAAVARASGSNQGDKQGIAGVGSSDTAASSQGIASAANPMFNPNVTTSGLGIGSTTQGYNPYANPLFLSKLSEFKYDAPEDFAAGGMAYGSGGGIGDLGSYSDGGRLLKGPGDGMSDHIPATIGAKQPARLAEGEFVIPADVVSHLGNGSTDAGAKQLYKMMNNIRRARTGNPKQGKQINPDKFTPKG